MRRAVVTGGNGFVGSSLITRLTQGGVEVHAIANENHQRLDTILPQNCIHVLRDGIGSAVEVITRVQPDTIYHLATVYAEPVSAESVLSMIDGNLTLGACLLFAATQCRERPVFVNTGTYWQFAKDATYAPNTLYAATKHAFQDLLIFYRERLGVRSVSLVLYDTFGPGDTRAKLWRRLAGARLGESIQLSRGDQTIHLVHIDDIVDAFLRAQELLRNDTPLGPIYSVSSAEPSTLRDLVERFNAEGQLGLQLEWGARPYWEGQVLEPWVGSTLPGWMPKVEILPALIGMAAQLKSHPAETAPAMMEKEA